MGCCSSQPVKELDQDGSRGRSTGTPLKQVEPVGSKKRTSNAGQKPVSSQKGAPASVQKPLTSQSTPPSQTQQAKKVKPPVVQNEVEKPLIKSFGFGRNLSAKYDLEEEVGRGHFGHTCIARVRKGDRKGEKVAIKVIPKAKILSEDVDEESNQVRSGSMSSQIAIDDVKREVKILKALAGHPNVVLYLDALEDNLNVYVVMELCEGGELLDRILARGGRYSEGDAVGVVRQILSVVAWCHLQGVVHRDLKPENFLFLTKEESAPLKAIDFGLSDYVQPDGKLDDIVGSAYYVAPEVLHRSYSFEADCWSVGVITYILLCGSRPFWARTESGIFRSVLRADPSFADLPWPNLSPAARDFVRKLLAKDTRRRLTAAQALSHPWVCSDKYPAPLDLAAVKSIRDYSKYNTLKRRALKALFGTLSEEEQVYTRTQFAVMDHNRDNLVTLDDIRAAMAKVATDAMVESRGQELLSTLDAKEVGRLDYRGFGAALLNLHQLEHQSNWNERVSRAFDDFAGVNSRPAGSGEPPRQGRRSGSFARDGSLDRRSESFSREGQMERVASRGRDDGTKMLLADFSKLVYDPPQRRQSERGKKAS